MSEATHLPTDLDVVVCGAGIGGLAAAASLRRLGIATTVLEQAPEVGEVGAGLQIGPNATKVLHRLGLAEESLRISLVVQETVNRRWRDGSIIAKTTRDALLRELDRTYPQYGFAQHKGYGTPEHLAALDRHGPCPVHRRSFAPVLQAELDF